MTFGVTEGGILGLTLLLEYWFGISPSVSGLLLTVLCYFLGWKLLGKMFLIYSFISAAGFSVFYGIFEQFEPLFPEIGKKPLLAAVVGALFVGISVGICVRAGGAPTGDDTLAMSLSSVLPVDIQWIYLVSDLVVLAASLSYYSVEQNYVFSFNCNFVRADYWSDAENKASKICGSGRCVSELERQGKIPVNYFN